LELGLTPLVEALVKQNPIPLIGNAELADRLEAARRVIEVKFLSAGEVLSEAVDGIGALITALDDLTGALDQTAIAATVSDLTDAAGKLNALPDHHRARRTVVSELDRRRAEFGPCLSDMRQSLAYMRAFTMNIKITAGGIAQADAEFGVFAHEISVCIEAGRAELDRLQQELDALQTPIATAARHGEAMAARCDDLIPLVPDQLTASAQLIGEHHKQIATAAGVAAELARDIRKRVGRILAALQIGDITRQRIEHVQSGLALITESLGALSGDQYARASALVQMLLAAQLGDAMQDFDREVGQIMASMGGLASDARALLKLRDLAYGQGADAATGVLQTLKQRLAQAQALVDEIESTEREVLRTGRITGDAAQILAGRLAAIQTMKSDVQYMALNTTLKSCRIGEAGRPLTTIAVELRAQAGYLEQVANKGIATLNMLIAAAAQLIQEGASADEGPVSQGSAAQAANQALGAAAHRIGQASDRSDSDIARLAERGEAVLALLNRSTGRFGFQEEIGAALDGVAEELATLAEGAQPCEPDIQEAVATLLSVLYAKYTMVQERSVQDAFLEAWNVGAPPPGAPQAPETSVPSASLDDILF